MLWMTVSPCLSYDQQLVNDIELLWRGLITSFSYAQQQVSDITPFVKGSLIGKSFPMTNSKSVTFHMQGKAVSSHPFLWPIVCEVIVHFVKGNFIVSLSITNRKWVTLLILWRAMVSSHLFIWPTGSEWHCLFFEGQSHIFTCDQQRVSNIAYFVKGSLITSFPVTNSKWVTLHNLWKPVTSFFFHITNREWMTLQCCEMQSHQFVFFNEQRVSGIAACETCSHHVFSYHQQLVSNKYAMLLTSHLFLSPTGSEWHFICFKRQSCHIFSYGQ